MTGKIRIKRSATLADVPTALDPGELALNTRDNMLFWADYNGTIRSLSLLSAGNALTTETLAQFASTTSLELAGVISDETGSGSLVFADSPALAGTPTAPTAAADTDTTQLATTAYVVRQASSTVPAANGTAAAGTSLRYAREDHVHPTDTSRAPLASPTFTGTPSAPTAAAATNTTQLATTAFVQTAVSTKANIASPAFTGTPTAPTAAANTNTTQIATTAYVQGELSGVYSAGGTDVAVADGGTGRSSATAYGVICGGTTSTGAHQSVSVGSRGQVLTSNGAGALPTMQNVMTLLGTLTTTSGSSQVLSDLVLTNYRMLVVVLVNVGFTTGSGLKLNNVSIISTINNGTGAYGVSYVFLATGLVVSQYATPTANPTMPVATTDLVVDTSIGTSTTTLTFTPASSAATTFDQGTIYVYGV